MYACIMPKTTNITFFDEMRNCYNRGCSYYSFRRHNRDNNLSIKQFGKILGKDIQVRKKYMKDGELDNVDMYLFINNKLQGSDIDTVLFGVPVHIENVDADLYVFSL
uniref:Uncharacterized protein n=1 Tax=viral metagenome TaxID=1070528 RepID=A0A6C0BGD2_9ZZZZ